MGNPFHLLRGNVGSSLRVQLILTFAFCLIAAFLVAAFSSPLLGSWFATPVLDYTAGMSKIDQNAREIVTLLTEQPLVQADTLQARIDRNQPTKTLIVDLDGDVLVKSSNATETHIDLYAVIQRVLDTRIHDVQDGMSDNRYGDGEVFYSFYPVSYQRSKAYVITYSVPMATMTYKSGLGSAQLVVTIFGLVIFILLFYLLTRRKMRYIEELADGLLEISKGKLSFRVQEKSNDELGSLARNINHMAQELQEKSEQERSMEQAKNELITNVSHDLRTPLTSIMGYLRLLIDHKFEDEEKATSYLQIAYSKSEQVKTMIDDLFEYSKLINPGVHLTLKKISIDKLVAQLLEEYVPLGEENQLRITFEKKPPMQHVFVRIDPDQMVRVFENLISNAIRYSEKPGEIKVGMHLDGNKVLISIENKGETIPPEELPLLFDRFYRMEKSRSSELGGSGLGLAIADSIVKLNGGHIWAESELGTIRFIIALPMME